MTVAKAFPRELGTYVCVLDVAALDFGFSILRSFVAVLILRLLYFSFVGGLSGITIFISSFGLCTLLDGAFGCGAVIGGRACPGPDLF